MDTTTPGRDLATIDATPRATGAKAHTNGTQTDLVRWLIIGAALFGAFLLMRGTRKFMHIALGFFWIWFWTHGAWRWIF